MVVVSQCRMYGLYALLRLRVNFCVPILEAVRYCKLFVWVPVLCSLAVLDGYGFMLVEEIRS